MSRSATLVAAHLMKYFGYVCVSFCKPSIRVGVRTAQLYQQGLLAHGCCLRRDCSRMREAAREAARERQTEKGRQRKGERERQTEKRGKREAEEREGAVVIVFVVW